MSIACSICTESLIESTGVIGNTCGHIYHQTCLLEWMKMVESCPQCRSECNSATIRKIYFNHAASTSSTNDKEEVLPLLEKKLEELKRYFKDNLKDIHTINQSTENGISRIRRGRKLALVLVTAFGFTIILLYMVFLHYSFNGAVGEHGYKKYAHEAIGAIAQLEGKLNNFSQKIDFDAEHVAKELDENSRLLHIISDRLSSSVTRNTSELKMIVIFMTCLIVWEMFLKTPD